MKMRAENGAFIKIGVLINSIFIRSISNCLSEVDAIDAIDLYPRRLRFKSQNLAIDSLRVIYQID